MPRGVVPTGAWQEDSTALACQDCGGEFSLVLRRHHCRGCGSIFCGSCLRSAPLAQYGFITPEKGCKACAGPYLLRREPQAVPTSGGDVTLYLFNAGADVAISLDNQPMEVKAVNTGQKDGSVAVTVTMPAGVGTSKSLTLVQARGKGLSSLAPVPYAPPTIVRTTALPTSGGELIIFGENLSNVESCVRVAVDGLPATGVTLKQPHHKLRVTAGPGTGLANIRVEVAGQSHDIDILRAAPEVTAVEPPDADLSGGSVSLTGANFGDDVGKVQVLLADFGIPASSVTLREPHTRLACVLPPLPDGAAVGEPIRLRVVVDGVHSSSSASVIYCPPYGIPAGPGRPAYVPKRPLPATNGGRLGASGAAGALSTSASGGSSGSGGGASTPTAKLRLGSSAASASSATAHSPYADLFAVRLPMEPASAASASASAGAAPPSAASMSDEDVRTVDSPSGLSVLGGSPLRHSFTSPGGASALMSATGRSDASGASPAKASLAGGSASAPSAALRRALSVRVGGTLASGPTLSITPPRQWAPDTAACELCEVEFTVTKRRHHCRICGTCVCGPCSPHTLKVSAAKPAVRVCTRCHLRVGLLNQMTQVIDSIRTISKVLPPSMTQFFRGEVIEAVGAAEAAPAALKPALSFASSAGSVVFEQPAAASSVVGNPFGAGPPAGAGRSQPAGVAVPGRSRTDSAGNPF